MDQKYSIPVRRVELVGANSSPLIIDTETDTLITMGYTEYAMHSGKFFMCDLLGDSLADNASFAIVFKTDSSSHYHIVPQFAVKAEAHLSVMENATWVASTGTLLPVYNRNRNSTITTSIEENSTIRTFTNTGNAISNPTTLTGGTAICSYYSFGDKKAGGKQRAEEEIVLATNTNYAFVIKADAGTNAGHLKLNWYEH